MKNSDAPYELIALANRANAKASRIDTFVGLILFLIALSTVVSAWNAMQALGTNLILLTLRSSFIERLGNLEVQIGPLVEQDSFTEYDFRIIGTDGDIVYRRGHFYNLDKALKRLHAVVQNNDGYITVDVSTYPADSALVAKYESVFANHMTPQFRGSLQDIFRGRANQRELVAPDVGILRISAGQDWFPFVALFSTFLLSLAYAGYCADLQSLANEFDRIRVDYDAESLERLKNIVTPTISVLQYRDEWWYPFSKCSISAFLTACMIMTFGGMPRISFYFQLEPPVVLDGPFMKAIMIGVLIVGSYVWTKRIVEHQSNVVQLDVTPELTRVPDSDDELRIEAMSYDSENETLPQSTPGSPCVAERSGPIERSVAMEKPNDVAT